MRVFTYASYDFSEDQRAFAMALMWLDGVQRNHDDEIMVMSEWPVEHFFRDHIDTSRFEWAVQPKGFCADHIPLDKWNLYPHIMKHDLEYKMYYLSHQTSPYFYLDLDTFVLEPLAPLFEEYKDWPIMFPHINSGIVLVNDPTVFSWSEQIAIAEDPNFRPKELGGDQTIYAVYFPRKGIDPYGNCSEWNAYAKNVKVYKEDGRWRGKILMGDRLRQANILHYWGSKKAWVLGCPIYEEFLGRC